MQTYIDQLGRTVNLERPPRRIISLVPSQTELLFELGLKDEIVGVSRFCVHPKNMSSGIARVGGTKTPDINLIRQLQPDLIIGNKEENTFEDIETLAKEFPVWMSDVNNLENAMEMINRVGALVDRLPEATYLNHLISAGFRDLETLAIQHKIKKKVVYLIWRNPYMAVGKDTFIHDILTKTGLVNVVDQIRYPELMIDQLRILKPDLVMLSSEPYPFQEKHIEELKSGLPGAEIMLVDGEIFSWYGSRLIKAVQYLFELQIRLK